MRRAPLFHFPDQPCTDMNKTSIQLPPIATLGPFMALLLACAFFATQSERFLSAQNFSLILQQVMVVGVIAIGQSLIILTAGIDLSCGMVMALGSVVMTKIASDYGLPAPAAIACGIAVTTLFGLINVWSSWRSGRMASSNPWGAATLEWTIPSPPPDYNFAELPLVKSRYPLWNMKGGEKLVHETTYEEEKGRHIPTSQELGIIMPNPSIWPLVTAFGLIVMFGGILFMDASVPTAVAVMLTGTAIWVGSLYTWLLTPLEDHH
jgi:hypothetical protein